MNISILTSTTNGWEKSNAPHIAIATAGVIYLDIKNLHSSFSLFHFRCIAGDIDLFTTAIKSFVMRLLLVGRHITKPNLGFKAF